MATTDKDLEALAADATPSGGDRTTTPGQLLGYRPTAAQAADPVDDAVLANQPLKTPPVTAEPAYGHGTRGPDLQGVDPMAPSAPPPGTPAVDPNAPPPPAPSVQAPDFGRPSLASAGAALDASTKTGFDAANAQADVGRAKADASAKNADELDRLSTESDRQKNEIQQFQDRRQAAIDAAQKQADQAQAEFKNTPIRNYWADRSTGERILSSILVGLGGYGAALVKQPNLALQVLGSQIDHDFRTQEANLRTKEKFAEWKKEGVTSLAQRFQEEQGLLKIKQAAATDQVANEVKAQLVRNGIAAEQAENMVQVQGLRQKALADNAAGREKLYAAQQQGALAWSNNALRRETAELARQDRQDKAGDAKDARTVQLDDGSDLTLPTARAVPQFTTGYNSRIQAVEKLKQLRADMATNKTVWGPDAAGNRQRLIDNALTGVASITPMGQSDHSTHVELGTLGPSGIRTMPWDASPDVALKAIDEKIKEISDGTDRTIRAMRKDGPRTPAAASAPTKAPTYTDAQIQLAREALKDPKAPGDVKAQAKKIVLSQAAK